MNGFLLRLAGLSNQKVLIFGVIAGAIYFFTMFDDGSALEARIATVQKQIQVEEVRAKESEKALLEVERVKAELETLGEQFRLVSKALPSEVLMADIIRDVDEVARKSRVAIKTKEPRPIVNREFYEEIPLKITMEGGFSEITQFLYIISSMERIMRVKSFIINVPSQTNATQFQPGRLIFEGQIVAFRFVTPPATPEKGKQKR